MKKKWPEGVNNHAQGGEKFVQGGFSRVPGEDYPYAVESLRDLNDSEVASAQDLIAPSLSIHSLMTM